jgi:hypothetical protein
MSVRAGASVRKAAIRQVGLKLIGKGTLRMTRPSNPRR